MLTIATISSADYYLEHPLEAVDEYYVRGEAAGHWVGRGAEALSLVGGVATEDMRSVLKGRSPSSGETLLPPTAPLANRRPGFDLTFSAPKGVSLIGLLGEREASVAVMEAHQRAVSQALGYLEDHATFVRRGKDGAYTVAADGLVGAAFEHVTSRLGDPQVHTHVLVANLAQGPDGLWSSLDSRTLFRHSRTAGFLYQAALRAELTESLGLDWRPVRRGLAEPAGIPEPVLAHFSRRRAQIEQAVGEAGATSAGAAQVAAYRTRAAKDHDVDRAVLVASWRLRAESLGLGRDELRSLAPGPRVPELATADELASQLLGPEGLTKHRSTFTRQETLRALAEAAGDGASVAALQSLSDFVLKDRRAVQVGAGRFGERWSTTELLKVEADLLASAVAARTASRGVVGDESIERALAERPGLAEEQAAAVRRLTGGGEGLVVLVGPGGTGKTFVLEAARSAWEKAGHRVVGTALAGRTAAALEEAAGVPSFTLARLLGDVERHEGSLPRGGVVLVDEAAMVGTRTLSRLWSATQDVGGKLVLIGDHHQVPEIEAGGAFAALARVTEAAELTENRRQAEAWEREALAQLRSGQPARAVEAYQEHGRVVLADSAPEVRRAMVADWWGARTGGADAVMFALARSDVDALNRLARALAQDAGEIAGPELDAGGRSFAVGDEVVALRPDRRLGVINGTRGKVSWVNPSARSLGFITKNGDEVVLPASYLDEGHLGWGYASTLHKGQGSTVDRAFLLGGEGLYREAGYTGMSRGRVSNDMYVVGRAAFDEESHLASQSPEQEPMERLVSGLSRSHAHQLALDQVSGASPELARPTREVEVQTAKGGGPGSRRPEKGRPPHHPPVYLTDEIGPRPPGGTGRRRWDKAARAVESYRARHAVTDPERALGPEPKDDELGRRVERRAAARLIERARPGHAHERSIREDLGR